VLAGIENGARRNWPVDPPWLSCESRLSAGQRRDATSPHDRARPPVGQLVPVQKWQLRSSRDCAVHPPAALMEGSSHGVVALLIDSSGVCGGRIYFEGGHGACASQSRCRPHSSTSTTPTPPLAAGPFTNSSVPWSCGPAGQTTAEYLGQPVRDGSSMRSRQHLNIPEAICQYRVIWAAAAKSAPIAIAVLPLPS
jgi:hypothetical protein